MGFRREFYIQPFFMVAAEMILMYVIWTFVMLILKSRQRRMIAGAFFFTLSLGVILWFTVVGRSSNAGVSLVPFISFQRAKQNDEFYRSMIMNVLLFVPFGLSLPHALPGKIKHKVLVTVLAGFLVSAGIEACQYFFSLGLCETDDVIMNTLGAFIGSTSYLLGNAVLRLNRRIKKND